MRLKSLVWLSALIVVNAGIGFENLCRRTGPQLGSTPTTILISSTPADPAQIPIRDRSATCGTTGAYPLLRRCCWGIGKTSWAEPVWPTVPRTATRLHPNTYGGPSWMSRNWHDRTADGSLLRGTGGVEDLGWYLDTNNTGDTSLTNGSHNGTLLGDVAPGMNNFFSAVGNGSGQPAENLAATTEGVNATFGGLTVADLVADLRSEVDANRTAIAHFEHWNLINGPGGPGQGSSSNDSEDDFEDSGYDFGDPSGGGRGEEWNGQTGADFLGHSVLVVGYETDISGSVTHLIVHDNWPTTVRNVKIPVGGELVAITTRTPRAGHAGSTRNGRTRRHQTAEVGRQFASRELLARAALHAPASAHHFRGVAKAVGLCILRLP